MVKKEESAASDNEPDFLKNVLSHYPDSPEPPKSETEDKDEDDEQGQDDDEQEGGDEGQLQRQSGSERDEDAGDGRKQEEVDDGPDDDKSDTKTASDKDEKQTKPLSRGAKKIQAEIEARKRVEQELANERKERENERRELEFFRKMAEKQGRPTDSEGRFSDGPSATKKKEAPPAPDRELEPEEYAIWRADRIAEEFEEYKRQNEKKQEETQLQALNRTVTNDYRRYERETPDFREAVNYLHAQLVDEFTDLMVENPRDEAQKAIINISLAAAMRNGSAAEVLYKQAKRYGYHRKEEDGGGDGDDKEIDLKRLNEKQKKSRSIGSPSNPSNMGPKSSKEKLDETNKMGVLEMAGDFDTIKEQAKKAVKSALSG